MLANIYTKTNRDRFPGVLAAAVVIGVLLWLGMAAYRDIDLSIYTSLPTAVRDMIGIPEGADAAGMGFGVIFGTMGALTMAGVAISMGSAAIAGEENFGTLGVLLGNPRNRTQVLLAKAASMVTMLILGGVLLWGSGVAASSALNVSTVGVDPLGGAVHLTANAVMWGMLALAIGSWTGNRVTASGGAAGLMIVSYLAAGLLPLIDTLADFVRLSPWSYFDRSRPAQNGVDLGDVAVLAGMSVVLLVVAWIGVNRRDLKTASSRTLLDRLRSTPLTKKLVDRLAGSVRTSRISVKAISERQGLLTVCVAIMVYVGLAMGPIWGYMGDTLSSVFSDLPDALIAMVGGVNMGTLEGFIQGEIFAITGPAVIITVVVILGSRALAGEEEDHTMGILLANPVPRWKVILEKTVGMIVYAVILGAVTFGFTWLGLIIGGVTMSVPNLLATSTLMTLMCLVFGGLALAVGAATGRTRLAGPVAAGAALVSYFLYSFLPLSDRLAPWAKISPFHYFLSSDPLVNGMAWSDAALLTALFVGFVLVAIPLFNNRDLRG